jgi:DMSO/TMAO reductase YedYZ molybdopterin-dependent catalytic subunit
VQQTKGALPEKGRALITSIGPSRAKTEVELKALTHDQRLARLKQGEEKLRQAAMNPETDISQPWRDEVLSLVAFDAPHSVETIKPCPRAPAAAELECVKNWQNAPANADAPTAIYEGQLNAADGVK